MIQLFLLLTRVWNPNFKIHSVNCKNCIVREIKLPHQYLLFVYSLIQKKKSINSWSRQFHHYPPWSMINDFLFPRSRTPPRIALIVSLASTRTGTIEISGKRWISKGRARHLSKNSPRTLNSAYVRRGGGCSSAPLRRNPAGIYPLARDNACARVLLPERTGWFKNTCINFSTFRSGIQESYNFHAIDIIAQLWKWILGKIHPALLISSLLFLKFLKIPPSIRVKWTIREFFWTTLYKTRKTQSRTQKETEKVAALRRKGWGKGR